VSATKAVILARGLGTRMRGADDAAVLDASQNAVADTGVKGLIPVGRPFIDYAVSALADAGITDVCIVIGPEHDAIRNYFACDVELVRVRIHFAIQESALGTANAVLAAEAFADGDAVLVVNSDNYYPVHTLRALCEAGHAAVAAFERDALIALGNIGAERVAKYSIIRATPDGVLERIVEKPDACDIAGIDGPVYVGMNSWLLPPSIYDACRAIAPSPRGELELPSAVQYATDVMGERFRVLPFRDAVLDLSHRGDVPAVAERLRNIVPRL
jgi:glucose-1-phosphate thymidylyltransferase